MKKIIVSKTVFMSVFSMIVALVGCTNLKPVDYSQMNYEDIPYDKFKELPHQIQYQIKYKNDCDTIITVERKEKVVVNDESGTPHLRKDTTIVDSLFLATDKIIFKTGIKKCKANLYFITNEEVYDKQAKKFTNYFKLDFIKDKSTNCLYLQKESFPNLNGIGLMSPFSYNINLTYGLTKNILDEYENNYVFTECHTIFKNELGKDNPSEDIFVLEENEMSKILKFLDYKGKSFQ